MVSQTAQPSNRQTASITPQSVITRGLQTWLGVMAGNGNHPPSMAAMARMTPVIVSNIRNSPLPKRVTVEMAQPPFNAAPIPNRNAPTIEPRFGASRVGGERPGASHINTIITVRIQRAVLPKLESMRALRVVIATIAALKADMPALVRVNPS